MRVGRERVKASDNRAGEKDQPSNIMTSHPSAHTAPGSEHRSERPSEQGYDE